MYEYLYRISLPYATFGIVVREGKVIETAPIAAWARGRDAASVLAYYRRKGGEVVRL